MASMISCKSPLYDTLSRFCHRGTIAVLYSMRSNYRTWRFVFLVAIAIVAKCKTINTVGGRLYSNLSMRDLKSAGHGIKLK